MAPLDYSYLYAPPIRIDDQLDLSLSHPLYRDRSDPDTCPIRSLFARAKTEKRPFYVAAPMVRYSKLPFRALVRDYACDLVYTPMILANEFKNHHKARDSDFSSNSRDRPLVVQFAAKDPIVLAQACEIVLPYTDAIGINCGCPQSWACKEGIGAHLMQDPQLVAEMVKAAKSRCGRNLVIETKIRVHKDIRRTVDWAHQMQAAGIDFLTVHGRTKNTRSSEPVDLDAIKMIRASVTVPVIANGDANTFEEVNRIATYTGADGIMSARGLLSNPALFAGYTKCPWSAIERFMAYASAYDLHPALVIHHLSEMMTNGGQWKKCDRIELHKERELSGIYEFLDQRYLLRRPGDANFGEVNERQRK